MVLLSAAIVFAGLGFLSLSGSDTDAAAAGTSSSGAPQDGSGGSARAADAASRTEDGTAGATTPASASAQPGSSRTTSSAAAPTSGSDAAGGASDAQAKQMPVRVYNNSTVEGLAGNTASTLETDGWSIDHVGNYNEGEVPHSAVYYGDARGEKAAAQKVASELGLPAEPRFAGISDASPGVIVILTADR